jgi:sugar phosphate isomerase/epimerase
MTLPSIGLSLFSFGYLGGFARRPHEKLKPVLSVEQLLRLAKLHGLNGIELPLNHCYPGLPAEKIGRLKERAAEERLFLSIDAETVDDPALQATIETAARLGQSFLRIKLSKVLGGNRYLSHADPESWFNDFLPKLKRAAAVAREHGVVLAVENHQDITSKELLRFIESIGDDGLGVNLDTGSVLATCEDPVEFAKAVAPVVRNIHLKDYRLVKGPHGFRLVRCALGAGVVDFAGIFKAIRHAGSLRASIELGAVAAREVHWLKSEYWQAYPARAVQTLVPFIRLLSEKLEPDSDWQTAWEKEETPAVLERVELEEIFRSVEFLKNSLGAPLKMNLTGPLKSLAELPAESVEVS